MTMCVEALPLQPDKRERYLRAIGIYSVLEDGLEDSLSLLQADRGNVQIVDPATGSLLIAVQAGFSDEFVEYFSSVDDSGSACGRAAHQVMQTVIADVTSDPDFAPHRNIAASSGFQAVQSTPLLDSHSHVVGVVSTHYPRPHRPADRDLALMRRHGELLGAAIEAMLEADAAAS